MAKKRNPSFEILRVVAMFLIVVWHFLMHGVGQKPDGITSDLPSLFNLCSMEMIGCLAKVSTNCYILITGYFIIHQTSPKWEKIPKTWAPIVFYSVLLFFVFLLCSNLRLGWDDFGKSLMPIYFNRYWFATRYVALVALSPFLAIVAQALTRRQYLVMLGVMAVINFDFLLGDQMSGNNSRCCRDSQPSSATTTPRSARTFSQGISQPALSPQGNTVCRNGLRLRG